MPEPSNNSLIKSLSVPGPPSKKKDWNLTATCDRTELVVKLVNFVVPKHDSKATVKKWIQKAIKQEKESFVKADDLDECYHFLAEFVYGLWSRPSTSSTPDEAVPVPTPEPVTNETKIKQEEESSDKEGYGAPSKMTLTSNQRAYIVGEIVKLIMPSTDPKDLQENWQFEKANDHEDYFRLLAEKIFIVQKVLKEKMDSVRRLESKLVHDIYYSLLEQAEREREEQCLFDVRLVSRSEANTFQTIANNLKKGVEKVKKEPAPETHSVKPMNSARNRDDPVSQSNGNADYTGQKKVHWESQLLSQLSDNPNLLLTKDDVETRQDIADALLRRFGFEKTEDEIKDVLEGLFDEGKPPSWGLDDEDLKNLRLLKELAAGELEKGEWVRFLVKILADSSLNLFQIKIQREMWMEATLVLNQRFAIVKNIGQVKTALQDLRRSIRNGRERPALKTERDLEDFEKAKAKLMSSSDTSNKRSLRLSEDGFDDPVSEDEDDAEDVDGSGDEGVHWESRLLAVLRRDKKLLLTKDSVEARQRISRILLRRFRIQKTEDEVKELLEDLFDEGKPPSWGSDNRDLAKLRELKKWAVTRLGQGEWFRFLVKILADDTLNFFQMENPGEMWIRLSVELKERYEIDKNLDQLKKCRLDIRALIMGGKMPSAFKTKEDLANFEKVKDKFFLKDTPREGDWVRHLVAILADDALLDLLEIKDSGEMWTKVSLVLKERFGVDKNVDQLKKCRLDIRALIKEGKVPAGLKTKEDFANFEKVKNLALFDPPSQTPGDWYLPLLKILADDSLGLFELERQKMWLKVVRLLKDTYGIERNDHQIRKVLGGLRRLIKEGKVPSAVRTKEALAHFESIKDKLMQHGCETPRAKSVGALKVTSRGGGPSAKKTRCETDDASSVGDNGATPAKKRLCAPASCKPVWIRDTSTPKRAPPSLRDPGKPRSVMPSRQKTETKDEDDDFVESVDAKHQTIAVSIDVDGKEDKNKLPQAMKDEDRSSAGRMTPNVARSLVKAESQSPAPSRIKKEDFDFLDFQPVDNVPSARRVPTRAKAVRPMLLRVKKEVQFNDDPMVIDGYDIGNWPQAQKGGHHALPSLGSLEVEDSGISPAPLDMTPGTSKIEVKKELEDFQEPSPAPVIRRNPMMTRAKPVITTKGGWSERAAILEKMEAARNRVKVEPAQKDSQAAIAQIGAEKKARIYAAIAKAPSFVKMSVEDLRRPVKRLRRLHGCILQKMLQPMYELGAVVGFGDVSIVYSGFNENETPVAMKCILDFNVVKREMDLFEALRWRTKDPINRYICVPLYWIQSPFKNLDFVAFRSELFGEDLFTLCSAPEHRMKRFTPEAVLSIVGQGASAVAYLNKHDYTHGDVKAEHLVLKSYELKRVGEENHIVKPEVRLVGLSHVQFTGSGETVRKCTRTSSPEAILGIPFTETVDSWSLAILAVELLLKRPFFNVGSHYDGDLQKQQDHLVRIETATGEQVPEWMWDSSIVTMDDAPRVLESPQLIMKDIMSILPPSPASDFLRDAISRLFKIDARQRATPAEIAKFLDTTLPE